jgi:hypothetical protein
LIQNPERPHRIVITVFHDYAGSTQGNNCLDEMAEIRAAHNSFREEMQSLQRPLCGELKPSYQGRLLVRVVISPPFSTADFGSFGQGQNNQLIID